MVRKQAVIVVVLAWLLIFSAGLTLDSHVVKANPSVLRVPQDYATIQAAVNAANSSDVIQVAAGVYLEHLTIDKSISLVGENRATTIINGNGTGDVVVILPETSFVTISGFTIKNGSARGIEIADYSTWITVSGNIVSDNDVGIDLTNGSFNTITGNIITWNTRTGIAMSDSYNNTISGNVMEFNQNQNIGLIWSSNNTIIGNSVNSSATGMVLSGLCGNNTIVGNTLWNNTNGVYLKSFSGTTPDNNTFYRNNFVNNTFHTTLDSSTVNMWDKGYPAGGNYWSNYTGVDLFRGRYQNQTGSDGIGDTPYIIDSGNKDNYPLMTPETLVDDVAPPVTSDNYNGEWHLEDFIIALTATDDLTGTAETYYKINGASTENVTTNGQPLITSEGANNTLEYWTVDWAGNAENPHKILAGIKLDKTDPSISLTSPQQGAEAVLSTLNVTWTGADPVSGIDHYEVRLDDGSWVNVETNTTKVFNGLSDGTHTIEVEAVDKAGRLGTDSADFTVRSVGFSYAEVVAAVVVLGTAVVGLLYFYSRRKKRAVRRQRASRHS